MALRWQGTAERKTQQEEINPSHDDAEKAIQQLKSDLILWLTFRHVEDKAAEREKAEAFVEAAGKFKAKRKKRKQKQRALQTAIISI